MVTEAMRRLPKENVMCSRTSLSQQKPERPSDDAGAGFSVSSHFSPTVTWAEWTPRPRQGWTVVSGRSGQSLSFTPLPQLLFQG